MGSTLEFCVWDDCNRRVSQHVAATSPDAAYRIAKENPEGWEFCFGHEDNGYRLSNDVQDVETVENFAIGSATHCKACGSEIVETINDSNFNECECGPCEYQRYKSQPDLLAACKESLAWQQQHHPELVENGWHELKAAIANARDLPSAPAACKTCGIAHSRKKPWNSEPEDLCPSCEQARIDELQRIATHHEDHPDECCCATYLGRECCMGPIHGDLYRAICIENGDRFFVEFRANSLAEAKELGQELASGWGGECVRVRKVSQTPIS